jgi:hypothetical protein
MITIYHKLMRLATKFQKLGMFRISKLVINLAEKF